MNRINKIPVFNKYTYFSPVIPKFYWDIESQEERIKLICKKIGELIEYSDTQTEEINIIKEQLQKLINDFEKFKESGFLDYYEQLLLQYVKDNGSWIIKSLLGFAVWFGLNDDGHFVAYSPETWADVMFDTGSNYEDDDYGHLLLLFS